MVDTAKPKIGYWKIRGLIAATKYALEYLGAEYEEVNYTADKNEDGTYNKDKWLAIKPTLGLDFINLPYVIDGENSFSESQAIMRWACNKYGPHLLGNDVAEKSQVD